MKNPGLDPLLNELLAGEESARCRASSLEAMLESGRRRRRERSITRAAMLAVGVGGLALAVMLSHPHAISSRLAMNATSSVPAATSGMTRVEAAAGRNASVRFISDDELLGLFPGRPVALIGAPGRQQLVFLDQGQEIESP